MDDCDEAEVEEKDGLEKVLFGIGSEGGGLLLVSRRVRLRVSIASCHNQHDTKPSRGSKPTGRRGLEWRK